jgi:hypothetical protein
MMDLCLFRILLVYDEKAGDFRQSSSIVRTVFSKMTYWVRSVGCFFGTDFCGTVSSRPPLRNSWNDCSKIFLIKHFMRMGGGG